MADSFIRVPPDSTGKLIDTSQITIGANDVQRERMIIGDNTTEHYLAISAAGGALVEQGAAGSVAAPWFVKLSDGAAAFGTSGNPIRVDPTGTTAQPIRTFDGAGNSISSTGGALDINLKTSSIALNVAQSGTWTVGLSAGTNVIGHVIADTGSTTAVTGTVTVAGTVTANAGTNLNTSLLQLDATGAALNLAQGSTTSGQTGPLVQTATTTSAPTYTTAKTNPLSTDTAGNLRVTGAVTGSGNFTVVQATGTNLHVVVDSGAVNATLQTSTGTDIGNVGLKAAQTLATLTTITNAVPTNADTTIAGTTAPTKSFTVSGKTNDGTPQYQIVPLGTGGRTVIIEGFSGGTAVPVSLASAPTTSVTQGTSPWVTNMTQWASTVLGTPTNFGTTPGAVIAGSVNASLFSGTVALGTPNTFGITAPTGNALGVNSATFIGTSAATSNSTTYSSKIAQDINVLGTLGTAFTTPGFVDIKGADGNVFVRQATAANLNATTVGTLTNNNAAPAGTNYGVLPAIASSSAQSYSAGNQVLLNTDLSGYLKVNVLADSTTFADEATFTQGTTSIRPIGGLYTQAPVFLTSGQAGAVQLTNDRKMFVFDPQEITSQDWLQQILLEIRALRMATVAMVTEAGSANPDDFHPGNVQDQYITSSICAQ